MSTYINHRAILMCTHGGQVLLRPPSYRSFHPGGSPVVTEPDLLRAPIIGCLQIGPGLKPCTGIVMILQGRARQILVDGLVPILDTLRALTNGMPPGIVTVLSHGGSNAQTESWQAAALGSAAETGAALCEICRG